QQRTADRRAAPEERSVQGSSPDYIRAYRLGPGAGDSGLVLPQARPGFRYLERLYRSKVPSRRWRTAFSLPTLLPPLLRATTSKGSSPRWNTISSTSTRRSRPFSNSMTKSFPKSIRPFRSLILVRQLRYRFNILRVRQFNAFVM